jgi:hypothetical protein
MASELYAEADDQPSLILALIDALAFWIRNPLVFWIVTLPIAGLAAAVAWLLDTHQQLDGWRDHWGWDFLFTLIYAMFLDRWIKASLLDGASECEEVDNLRRSIVAPRFLAFATVLFGLALALPLARYPEVATVLWASSACLFALLLPSLSAAEPLTFGRAFAFGRPIQTQLFLLIAGVVLVSLFAGIGLERALALLPHKIWHGAALAAAGRVVDCLMLAMVGHVLATFFREATGWQAPEPDHHPYRYLTGNKARTRHGANRSHA